METSFGVFQGILFTGKTGSPGSNNVSSLPTLSSSHLPNLLNISKSPLSNSARSRAKYRTFAATSVGRGLGAPAGSVEALKLPRQTCVQSESSLESCSKTVGPGSYPASLRRAASGQRKASQADSQPNRVPYGVSRWASRRKEMEKVGTVLICSMVSTQYNFNDDSCISFLLLFFLLNHSRSL